MEYDGVCCNKHTWEDCMYVCLYFEIALVKSTVSKTHTTWTKIKNISGYLSYHSNVTI